MVTKPTHDALSRRTRTRPQATGKRVTPQERDFLWFQKIHQHGPLSSSYLHTFSAHIRRNEKRAKDRLTDLFNESRTPHGGPYLTRPAQQFRTLDSRYNDLVYDLAPAAEKALKNETPRQRSGPWLHTFMVSCITASFELATINNDDINFISQSDILSRAKIDLRCQTTIIDPKTKRAFKKDLIPDALFGLEYRRGKNKYYRFFVVEADRGTEPATSQNFNRKSHLRSIQQYRDYIGNGLYKKHLGLTSNLMVLNVFTEPSKLKRMMTLTDETSGHKGNTYMLFKTIEAFGLIFRPPKPLFDLLGTPWQRAGQNDFSISDI